MVGLLFGSLAYAVTVDKISKDKMSILLRLETGESLSLGDRVCVQTAAGNQLCGNITRFRGSQPVAEMESLVEKVKQGDLVKLDSHSGKPKSNQSRLGLKLGLVEAGVSVKGTEIESFSRSGLGGGVMWEMPLAEPLMFQAGLGFAEYGYQIPAVKGKVTHSCIEAEVLLKYRLGPLFSMVGLAPAYGISTKAYLDGELLSSNGEEVLKPFLLSAVFGFGTSGEVGGNKKLGFDLKYLLGLTNMSPVSEGTIKNSAFFLGLTFWF